MIVSSQGAQLLLETVMIEGVIYCMLYSHQYCRYNAFNAGNPQMSESSATHANIHRDSRRNTNNATMRLSIPLE